MFDKITRSNDISTNFRVNKRIFLKISSFQILAMFRRGLFYSFLSIYLRFFLGLSVTETTFFATFPMVLNVLSQTFIWGNVSDKFQLRRTLIILGEISAAITTFLVWYVHTIPKRGLIAGYVIIIGLSIVEIFWSMSNVGWSALLSDLYPEHQRTELQGKLSSVGAIGRIIGVWIGGIAYDGMSYFYDGWGFDKGLLFFIASGVMVISIIPMFFVPEGGIGKVKILLNNKKSSISKNLFVFLLAMLFINFGINSVALIKSQYLSLDEGFNVSSSLLSYIVNTGSIAIFVVGLFIKRISNRFRDEILLFFSTMIAILYLIGFAAAENLAVIFLSDFLFGASNVIITASSYSFASKLIPPESRGKQFALFNATLFLSWGIPGTFIVGPIVDQLIRSGTTQVFAYRISFVTAASLTFIGLLILLFVIKMNKRVKKSPLDVNTHP